MGEGCLKLDVQVQGVEEFWTFLDKRGAGGGAVLKILQTSWTSYMYRPLAKLNQREDYVSLTLIIQK